MQLLNIVFVAYDRPDRFASKYRSRIEGEAHRSGDPAQVLARRLEHVEDDRLAERTHRTFQPLLLGPLFLGIQISLQWGRYPHPDPAVLRGIEAVIGRLHVGNRGAVPSPPRELPLEPLGQLLTLDRGFSGIDGHALARTNHPQHALGPKKIERVVVADPYYVVSESAERGLLLRRVRHVVGAGVAFVLTGNDGGLEAEIGTLEGVHRTV